MGYSDYFLYTTHVLSRGFFHTQNKIIAINIVEVI